MTEGPAEGIASVAVDENDRAGAVLLEPKARYTRVVDRYECPMCGNRLGERHDPYGEPPKFRLYTDTQHRDLTKRVFHPCGCVDIIPTGHGKGA